MMETIIGFILWYGMFKLMHFIGFDFIHSLIYGFIGVVVVLLVIGNILYIIIDCGGSITEWLFRYFIAIFIVIPGSFMEGLINGLFGENPSNDISPGFNMPKMKMQQNMQGWKDTSESFREMPGTEMNVQEWKATPESYQPFANTKMSYQQWKSLPISYRPVPGTNMTVQEWRSMPDSMKPVPGTRMNLQEWRAMTPSMRPVPLISPSVLFED
jgi:hypothetical protein